MSKVLSSDPNKLEYKSGGGCMALFGLPFLLVGLFVMALPFFPGDEGKPPLFFSLPFGGIFALVGAGFVFGRSSTTFDKRLGSLRLKSGVLGINSETEHSLDDFSLVEISRETRGSGKNRRTVFPVKLKGEGDKAVEIEAPVKTQESRSTAEDIAKFLDLPMMDVSTGAEIIREVGTLDYSLKERFQAEGYVPQMPQRPEEAKCRYESYGSTHKVHVPAPGFDVLTYIQIGCGVVFAGLVSISFIPVLFQDGMPLVPKIILFCILGGFAGIPLITVAGFALSKALTTHRVEVSPQALLLERKGLIRSSTERLPADEIEELEIVSRGPASAGFSAVFGGACIMARSDEKTLTFGQGLSQEELEWLIEVVEYGLCS